MADTESYEALLNPIKDIEKSFTIDIAEILQLFLQEWIAGNKNSNFFKEAAMLLQGSASVYAKKVEYLHKLAALLHGKIFDKNKDEQQQQQPEKETKERKKKVDKFNDPFMSVDFKMGKNLSCLRKKNLPKTAAKKPSKKIRNVCNPVHLLTNDNDDKGEVFYDTKGDIVGNKTDFALNKCRLISSGWLLLPSVNPNLVPLLAETPDYYDDSDNSPCAIDTSDIQANDPDPVELPREEIQSSPDDGFGSYPPSSEVQEVPTSEINSENNITDTPCASTAPPSTDEGIGSTPNEEVMSTPNEADDMDPRSDVEMMDLPDVEDIENIPVEGRRRRNANQNPAIDRNSVRRALKTCQLPIEDDPLAGLVIDKSLLVRRKIDRRNTRRLPSRLKEDSDFDDSLPSCPIGAYCSRAFFVLDERSLRASSVKFDTDGFDQHSGLVRRMIEKIKVLRSTTRKKNIDPIEDETVVDVEGIENFECDDGVEKGYDLVQDEDILIERDLTLPHSPPTLPDAPPIELDHPLVDDVIDAPDPGNVEMDDNIGCPDFSSLAQEQCENYIKDVHDFMKTSDITLRVHEWEKGVKPFLEKQKERGNLDLNFLGSQILDAFEDSNRKQTMTFRKFCRHKEKWEIHRYFMSLLPLANMGNVAIEAERLPDDSDQIFITLLSRKMHHIELENFGHNDGSHT